MPLAILKNILGISLMIIKTVKRPTIFTHHIQFSVAMKPMQAMEQA
jgi:hypothetical protein